MGKGNIFSTVMVNMVILITLMGFTPAAMCSEASTGATKNWQFNLAPFYLWAVTIDGDMTSGTDRVPVKVPFSDLFDNLEAAFIVHFEGMHKSNWGFLIDIDYLSVSNNVNLPGPIDIPANVDFDATLAEFSGLYRIDQGDHSYDLIAGLRYTKLENKATAVAGPTLVDGSQDWIVPLIGMRWRWGFADQIALVVRGDMGGIVFGSDVAVQGLALVDWQPFTYVSFLAGYRAIYQDYKDGGGPDFFRFDATMHGPLLGVNFRW